MGAYSRGSLYEGGGGAYEIIVDIKKTLLEAFVYFCRNFFMSIYLITTKSMNLLW